MPNSHLEYSLPSITLPFCRMLFLLNLMNTFLNPMCRVLEMIQFAAAYAPLFLTHSWVKYSAPAALPWTDGVLMISSKHTEDMSKEASVQEPSNPPGSFHSPCAKD